MASVIVDMPRQSRRSGGSRYEDDYEYDAVTTVAPAYRDYEYREASNKGALIRPTPHIHSQHTPTVIEEPVIEHEHHHLHHHIDHGDASGGLRHAIARPSLGGRDYSYDDLDIRERRYHNGATVASIHASHHDVGGGHRRRHRHRHRGRHGSVERTRISRSDLDLTVTATSERGGRAYEYENDDVTVVDVPPGTRRVYVNVEKQRERERDNIVDWRREHGVRRSRGLGNELWTEITKDLVTREAIEDLGYQFEETDFFYYIFEYLDRDQIAELRELTEDIRHERAKDIEYQSIAGSTPRVLPMSGSRSDFDDTRTEIVVETGGRRRSNSRHRRRYYY